MVGKATRWAPGCFAREPELAELPLCLQATRSCSASSLLSLAPRVHPSPRLLPGRTISRKFFGHSGKRLRFSDMLGNHHLPKHAFPFALLFFIIVAGPVFSVISLTSSLLSLRIQPEEAFSSSSTPSLCNQTPHTQR